MSLQYDLQLYEGYGGFPKGALISADGGQCYVVAAGDAAKVAITDEDGVSLTNPIAMTGGNAEFYVANTVADVDVYMMTPGGQFVTRLGLKSGPTDIGVDVHQKDQVAIVPFSMTDMTAATEFDTGIELPTDALVFAEGMSVDTITVDATETIDVGILSTESNGDANGFMNLMLVSVLGNFPAKGTFTIGSNEVFALSTTLGALVVAFGAGLDAATDTGQHAELPYRIDGTAHTISITPTAGSDTAEGFAHIPYQLK